MNQSNMYQQQNYTSLVNNVSIIKNQNINPFYLHIESLSEQKPEEEFTNILAFPSVIANQVASSKLKSGGN